MEVQRYVGLEQSFDRNWIEEIILELSDAFQIRILWDREVALVTSACALAGGLVGGYAGGRLGAALGAGIGTATGLTASAMVSLRELWSVVKQRLQELTYMVVNFLRRLDPVDYWHAFEILMACASSRRELVYAIVELIATKLGREVISSITQP